MSDTTIQIIPAMETLEGAGVTVHRTIATPSLRHLDPFMLLDHIGSDSPDEYIAGFPDHPHRGFNTFTYMIDGHMQHKDSMGNQGDLGPGDAQWMKAASGVIHSEMPQQQDGLMRGFQLWINLPAANKMDDPEYQEYASDQFPVIENDNFSAKILIGSMQDTQSPISDDITDVSYIDVTIAPQRDFSIPLTAGHNTFIYLFEGSAEVNGHRIEKHTLVVAGSADRQMSVKAGDSAARLIFVSGKPINESVVQYGPFVMNTRDEIEQAMRDFQSNNFVRTRAWMNKKK